MFRLGGTLDPNGATRRSATPVIASARDRANRAASLLLSGDARAVTLPDLSLHLHRLPEPLRVRALPDARSRQEARRDDRGLRADRSRSSCRSSTRAGRSTTRSSSLVEARLPAAQARGHGRRRLLDRRQLRVGVQGARASSRNVRVLRNAVQHGQAQGHQPRRARVDVRDHRVGRLRRHRRIRPRCASWSRGSPRPTIAAVGGRIHVSNPNENWLTRLQTIKYYFGQEHLKNLERGARVR